MKFDHSNVLGREVAKGVPDLRERSEYWRLLVHAVMQTDDSVVITTVFGIIQFVNPAFERSTGYSAQEAVGRTPALVKSGQHAPEFFAALWKSIRNGEVFRAIFTNRRKNGDIYYEEKTITPIRDESTEITHFVSTGRDVTSRVLADARMEYLANLSLIHI